MNYIEGNDYHNCIIPTDLDFIKSVKDKTIGWTEESLLSKCKYAVTHCELLLEAYEKFHKPEVNKDVDTLLHNVTAEISDMSVVVYRRSAGIHTYLALNVWYDFFSFSCKRIVK